MPLPVLRSLKSILLGGGVLLVLGAAIWLAIGPFFLSRTITLTLAAKHAGQKWSLEWQGENGAPINGVWIEAVPDQAGTVQVEVNQPIPNYRFACLALRWWEAPGVELSDPGLPRLTERVLWFHSEPELTRSSTNIEGTKLGHDSFTSTSPDGGAVWQMPPWTLGRTVDLATVCVLVLIGGALVRAIYRLGDLRARYNPELLAILIVVGVHIWLALRSPLLFCPDSMDYAVNALWYIEKPATALHLNAWRLPGYSVFLIPFLRAATHYGMLLGCAQGVLAVLTAWIASRITRTYLSRPWGALTILLVGLDPVLQLWTRHAMPEILCAFLVTLITWCAVQRRAWVGAPVFVSILGALGLGVLAAALCYVRGNYQVLIVLAPIAIATWPCAEKQWRRGLLLGLVMFAAGAGCLIPAVLYNYRENKRAEFVVGSGYTQANSLLEARALDRNQSGAFSFQEWQQAKTPPPDSPGSNEFLAQLYGVQAGPIATQTRGLPAWTEHDRRAAAVARESIARHPRERWQVSGAALLRLVGPWDPPEGSENDFWSLPMRQSHMDNMTQPYPPPVYLYMQQSKVQDIYDRTATSTLRWIRSGEASVYDSLFRGAAAVRPLWALLYLIGLAVALARREWSLLVVGVIALAHAAALAILLFDGIDRYQAPFYPLMSVVACYAIAAMAGAARREAQPASRTIEDQ